jgi:hypothetical protein
MQTASQYNDLKDDIHNFVQRLETKGIDNLLLGRLIEVSDNLDSPNPEWYSVDFYKTFNPALLLELLRSSYRSDSSFIGVLEIIRNVLVLTPIFLTWFALSKATAAYRELIAVEPKLITEPFLLLWEKGFEGNLTNLSFSHVAFYDTILIGIIIGLTFVVHLYQNKKSEEYDREALYLTSLFSELIWRINKAINRQTKPMQVQVELTKQMTKVVSELSGRSADFQNILTAEQDRLAHLVKINHEQILDLNNIMDGFENSSTELSKFSNNINHTLAHTNNLISEQKAITTSLNGAQIDLTKNLISLQAQFRSFEDVSQGIMHTMGSNFNDLSYAAHVELTQMNKNILETNKQTDILVKAIQGLVSSQDKILFTFQREVEINTAAFNSFQQSKIDISELKKTNNEMLTALVTNNSELIIEFRSILLAMGQNPKGMSLLSPSSKNYESLRLEEKNQTNENWNWRDSIFGGEKQDPKTDNADGKKKGWFG